MKGLGYHSIRAIRLEQWRGIGFTFCGQRYITPPERIYDGDAIAMTQLETLPQEGLIQKKRSIVTSSISSSNTTSDDSSKSRVKISVIGIGQVGLAAVNAIIQRGFVTDLAFVDVDEKRIRSEQLDIHQSGAFLRRPIEVTGSKDYSVTAGSKIVVITAGMRQKPGEKRSSLLERNVEIFKTIVPPLICANPNAILLVATNPVDELTYLAYKLSGFPIKRVIGSGTNLDTGRLRIWIAEKLKLRQEAVTGWVIGEHGDLSIPVWSSVKVLGKPLLEVCPTFKDYFEEIRVKVVRSAFEIIDGKGYTSWGIGSSIADICETMIKNNELTHATISSVKGQHDVCSDTFVSLPSKLGPDGFNCFDTIKLCDDEKKGFHEAVKKVQAGQDSIKL